MDKDVGKCTFCSCACDIHSSFDRALEMYKGDVNLWLDSVSYAKAESSHEDSANLFQMSFSSTRDMFFVLDCAVIMESPDHVQIMCRLTS